MLRFKSSFRLDQTNLAFVIGKLRKRSLPFILLTLAACVVCSVVVASYWATSSHAEVAAPATVRQIGPNFKPAYKVAQRKQHVATNAKNVTKALSVVSGDLDNDAVPDLITGFGASRGPGSITVQRGNPDAYAPKDEALLQRIQQGYDPPSFLVDTQTYNLPERVDFLSVADLNDDGNPDVLAGAAGGGLYVLMGSRTGELSAPESVNLVNGVTGLATGEFGK